MNAQKGAPFPLGLSLEWEYHPLVCGFFSFFHLIMQPHRNQGFKLHRFSRSRENKIETLIPALYTEQISTAQQNEKRNMNL
jgi:hypothetical protein